MRERRESTAQAARPTPVHAQYNPTDAALSHTLDARADGLYAQGQKAANTGDKYVRATVILARVLFLVGISSQFPIRGVRYGLIGVGCALLLVASFEILLALPAPP